MAGFGHLRADDGEFKKYQDFIQRKIGIKFPESKKSLLESRLSSYLTKNGYKSFLEYFEYIEELPLTHPEIDFLVDKITTHTTSFFRENFHFDFLKEQGVKILADRFKKTKLKCISLGSSTGEEMYTLAMVLEEQKRKSVILDYQIDAADVSRYALLKAKEGVFKKDHLESIPAQYRSFFDIKDERIIAKDFLKKNMRFFIINICKIGQKFPDNYHLIFCRNTLIYFTKTLQQNVIDNVAKILIPGGIFIMGHSESLHGINHNFSKLEPTIFQTEVIR